MFMIELSISSPTGASGKGNIALQWFFIDLFSGISIFGKTLWCHVEQLA